MALDPFLIIQSMTDSFVQLDDKVLSGEILGEAVWNHRMDLVAAAISSSEVKGGMSGDEKSGVAVTVHRLPWSKTYTLNPPPDDAPTKTPPVPCSMAWSPDGKSTRE